ncbi:zinc finger protein 638 isoform X2 [Hippoglossus stenolepis]|uniref:zinc finger protein 638 isoform X2 n=1 Tax=Hippoglossus stenolepis TaxID=195615 RepID=UPI001FAEE964|nr:zinc finger protein 638 isoform X2 [Hippoglossus stenolepis]
MLPTNKKKRAHRTGSNLTKEALRLAVHTDSYLHLAPTQRLEPRATLSIANSIRRTNFILGPVAGAAAVTALHLAQIETQAQFALQQLASLATITVGIQCHNNRLAAALPRQLALLSLLNRREVSAIGFNLDTKSKTYKTTQLCLPATMYHHHSQPQGPQPFSNGPRPHHQPHPNQHQSHTPSDMLTQVMGFQFPRPTQLPEELESALAIRGARDMDHRMNTPNQHQNQGSVSGISQHGTYGSTTLTSDSQPGHQQDIDWSSYQPPTKLFAGPPCSSNRQSHRQGPQQQPEINHAGTSIPGWTAAVSDSPSPQSRHPHGGRSGGGGDGQSMYTPESAGSILASFGLSNEDLEVLSHYPDDQLTPDTLPFILRDIQINKSGKQKTVASNSPASFSRSIHDMQLPPAHSSEVARSRSPEVPSLLTVTQTAGKVIDYGHASRAKDETNTRETFKREPLSNERTVKMYPSSTSDPKADKPERRQVHLENPETSKHGDRDYRRASSDHHKRNRSPGRELPPPSKSRNLDRDYRHDRPKPRPSSETRSEDSSRRSLSSSSGSKPLSSKKLPTPTMISDFLAVCPKVYPHTCSLCHTQSDQEKDWVDHINTVNHTAACRDLRNKYPDWKPNLPSRSGRYGSQSPSHSTTGSHSSSPSPGPLNKHRVGTHPNRPHGKLYSPHHHPRYNHYSEHGNRLDSPCGSHRISRVNRPEKRESGVSSRSGVKHPHNDSTKCITSQHPSSSKMGHISKHGPSQSKIVKSGAKTGTKMPKTSSAKVTDTSVKPPQPKKKKKMVTPASQYSSVAERLVYLTGIPKDASEQEVTDLLGSFGKINNVILMPCSDEESDSSEGQKASVCMVKAEDAQALANSKDLSIRDQQITASTAKKPEEGQSSDSSSSKPGTGQERGTAGEDTGNEADQKTSDEKGVVLISGLPENSCSESDIIKLIQPFGTPSDIILATQIRKALVLVPDMELAQEIVKVHSFMPAKIGDSELKIIQVKQRVGLSTPVGLYNLMMESVDPLESPVPVCWNSLLVISNVPNTPSCSSEVQKLVRRFGTVIKTLVLNNMVICEMATAAMALSVYKRFQTFPCIIQNNPLIFSRKPDPKASTQTKVITAYLDSAEDASANGKSSQSAAAADEEPMAQKEKSKCLLEVTEEDAAEMDKKMSTEETVGKEEALERSESKDKIPEEELASAVCDSLAAPDSKPEAASNSDAGETSAVKTVLEAKEEKKVVDASEAGNDKTPAAEETKLLSADDKVASGETVMQSELPKVTQEMVNTLLVECRTRTMRHPGNVAASASGVDGETPMETGQGEKAGEDTKEQAKNSTDEETQMQEREKTEREARKEKERKEKERRAWEREHRAKRERDERGRREREKREEERRELERRERKRAYGEGLSGSRSSCRSEGYKHTSRRNVPNNNSEAEKTVDEEEEFPFNLSDFVTVDEVGDVTDLPRSPSPVIPMETTEVQQDTPEDTPMEVVTETTMPDATLTAVESNEQVSECEPVSELTAESTDSSVSTPAEVLATEKSTSLPASQADSPPSQSPAPTCQPEAPDTEPALIATGDSAPEVEHLSMPSPSDNPPEAAPVDPSSNNLAAGAESEEDKNEDRGVNPSKAEEDSLDKSEEQERMHSQEDKETGTPAPDTAKQESSELTQDQTHKQKESVKKSETKTPMSTDCSLPPFDPSNPVGMEFLVPKTGFFCKVCNRFFSGTKEAEISHCKTAKHYENLLKYLQNMKTAKPDPS